MEKALAANPAPAGENFYHEKIRNYRHFFAYEAPKIRSLAARLRDSGDGTTLTMKPEWFD